MSTSGSTPTAPTTPSDSGPTTDFGGGVTGVWEAGPGYKKYKVKLYQDGKYWKSVTFGDSRYQQYRDQSPLGLYSDQDHLDEKRRDNYRSRHGAQGYQENTFTPAWFSWNYLW